MLNQKSKSIVSLLGVSCLAINSITAYAGTWTFTGSMLVARYGHTQFVLEQAVKLRKQHKMSLGDSIIAATALLNHLTLVTANIDDFQWINDIKLLNPLAIRNR